MKLKWIVPCCLGLWIAQACAEETIVINADTLGAQATGTQTPVTQVPGAQMPGTQIPDIQTPPAADAPGTQADVQPNIPAPDAATTDTQLTDTGAASLSSESTTAQAESIKDRAPMNKMSARQRQAMAKIALAEDNKKNGEAFQADYRNKPGVVALASGVLYKILREGKGVKPAAESLVVCRYRGTLLDGTEFEGTGKRPMSVYVATFLPGLKEAVMLMPAGSKWQIVVPPQLAYRELGNRAVGPNATLIYEMELLTVK